MFKKILTSPITYIIVFALIIRIVMVNYGLPFWLYNDEPPFVLAALKMMQLKSILPVLHESDFTPFLYYPPYISYLYLPFFVITALFSYAFFNGSLSEFQSFVASDPSIFFLTGRVIMILISLISIYLIYRIVLSLTKDRLSALTSALLAATSSMHIILSITGKHWMPILFFYALGLFCLSNESWSFRKRFLLSALITGIGAGVSSIIILFTLMMVFWYLFIEKRGFKKMFTDIVMYQSAGIVILLFILPILLYPASLGFVPDMTLHDGKTIFGLISSPFVFPYRLIIIEPLVTLMALIGLVLGIRKYKSFYISSALFLILYSFAFYMFFRFEYRFLLPFILFISICAGYGVKELKERIPSIYFKIVLAVFISLSLIISIRLSYLGSLNDSRILAKEWLDSHVGNNTKVIVYANLMRLPNNKIGINEQGYIDPQSLRTNDKNEKDQKESIRKGRIYQALNLYTVRNDNFYNNIAKYIKDNKYEYLVIGTQDFLNNPEQFNKMRKLTENATLLVKYGNNVSDYSLGKTDIGPTLLPLFEISEFGPEIEIYKLNN